MMDTDRLRVVTSRAVISVDNEKPGGLVKLTVLTDTSLDPPGKKRYQRILVH
jgi:hypothetical protein